jgi:hypothetical protein
MAGQWQLEAEQQQEKSGALEKYDSRLTKSLFRRRTPMSNASFHFFALKIVIGGIWSPAALSAQTIVVLNALPPLQQHLLDVFLSLQLFCANVSARR